MRSQDVLCYKGPSMTPLAHPHLDSLFLFEDKSRFRYAEWHRAAWHCATENVSSYTRLLIVLRRKIKLDHSIFKCRNLKKQRKNPVITYNNNSVVIVVCCIWYFTLSWSYKWFSESTDVAEGDPDADCRTLAVQSLVLLDKSLKKQLGEKQSSWSQT